MALPWKTVFLEVPVNLEVVWIRVLNIYGELTLAQYIAANQTFVVQSTGIIIPVYFVSRWKSQ